MGAMVLGCLSFSYCDCVVAFAVVCGLILCYFGVVGLWFGVWVVLSGDYV